MLMFSDLFNCDANYMLLPLEYKCHPHLEQWCCKLLGVIWAVCDVLPSKSILSMDYTGPHLLLLNAWRSQYMNLVISQKLLNSKCEINLVLRTIGFAFVIWCLISVWCNKVTNTKKLNAILNSGCCVTVCLMDYSS